MFGDRGEEYKTELISELEDGKITTYTQGAFTDLCRGPHLPNTSYLKAVKIMSVAGAYWRGDEKRKQLVRLYGITFPKKKKPRNGTIVRLAKNWSCLRSLRQWEQGFRCGCRVARSCA